MYAPHLMHDHNKLRSIHIISNSIFIHSFINYYAITLVKFLKWFAFNAITYGLYTSARFDVDDAVNVHSFDNIYIFYGTEIVFVTFISTLTHTQ